MADEAPISSGAAVAAPAAPAAAPSTPSQPSTPAPAAEAAPVTPAAPEQPQGPKPGEDGAAFLQRRAAERAEKAKAADAPKPAEVAEQPKIEAPDQPKVEEPKKEDAKPAEVAAEDEIQPEDRVIDPVRPPAPKELAEAIRSDKALAAALDANPELKDKIFMSSRLAAREERYSKLFGDPETAEYEHGAAQQFHDLFAAFMDAGDPNGTRRLLSKLNQFSTILDEDGKPQVDPQTGLPMTDGFIGRFGNNMLTLALEYQEQIGKQNKDDDLLAAIEILKERTGLSRGTSSAAEEANLTEAQKAERAAIAKERADLDRTKEADLRRKEDDFEKSVASGIEGDLDKYIGGVLDKTDLKDFNRNFVTAQIKEEIYTLLGNSSQFLLRRDDLMRRPMGEKTKQARVALGVNEAKKVARGVIAKVLGEAGVKLQQQTADAKARSDARQQASRSEQPGGSNPPAPRAPMSTPDLHREGKAALTAQFGREPSTQEMMTWLATRRKQLAQAG